jgi:drug/metabolite transporter (DMT)-like permease
MPTLTRQQLVLLVLLTVVWGLNWPIMKIGVTGYPPLTFRALSMWVGLPVLGLALVWLKVPFRLQAGPGGRDWLELLKLAFANMFVWHVCIILAVSALSSGRAAILGYTMPIFSALLGAVFFAAVLSRRGWLGVGAAAVGVVLLLWHEFTALSGKPEAVGLALLAAASWALGTQLLRRTALPVPTLTISFWMTALTAVVMTAMAWWFEAPADGVWPAMGAASLWAMLYNGVMIFGFAHATWFFLARSLPPVASTLSVMLIPVLGVFSGALWLREQLFWQDYVAMALMVVSIASVLWPSRAGAATEAKTP